jgi:hypothetical protein
MFDAIDRLPTDFTNSGTCPFLTLVFPNRGTIAQWFDSIKFGISSNPPKAGESRRAIPARLLKGKDETVTFYSATSTFVLPAGGHFSSPVSVNSVWRRSETIKVNHGES